MGPRLSTSTSDAAAREIPGRRAPVLEVSDLRMTFGPTVALDGVALTVERGQVHALLGENGSGKSTLIKILAGYHRPDPGGRVLVAGRPLPFGNPTVADSHGCRFVHQDLGLVDSLSVVENLFLTSGFPSRWGTIRWPRLLRAAREDLARVGLDLDPRRPVAGLSPAVRTGLAVARALRPGAAEVALLVLDEPTATLPDDEVRQLLDIVRAVAAAGTGVLYVTHHLDEVFDVADVATVLRDGRVVATTPVPDLTRGRLVNQLLGSELDEAHASSQALPAPRARAVLKVRDVAAGPLRSLSVQVRAGELVGIAGLTGSGRESVLAAVFGMLRAERGEVMVNDVSLRPGDPRRAIDAGVAYLPANRKTHGGIMNLTGAANLTLPDLGPLWRPPLLRLGEERTVARTWFAKLDVRPAAAVHLPLAALSGGNQQKVLLAKWLRCRPRVLLLDEPTQGVDIGAKAQIHQQIVAAADGGAAVVVSSADVDELVALCHRVVVLRGGHAVAELSGEALSVPAVNRAALAAERTT
ncbi:ABC transporter related protein [Pseudofrankia inefficax]|uniref:ABC transporter related protein n=1 Tax=Pseudofrankia inefficax (strain DSM 45817 / CECT 9037 / DDB 130130 / EuI1c) TaxID=298654 RepID=E3IWR0_PSEI1|nr:ABC transporter related protein [Pseudofrankia inefficax]